MSQIWRRSQRESQIYQLQQLLETNGGGEHTYQLVKADRDPRFCGIGWPRLTGIPIVSDCITCLINTTSWIKCVIAKLLLLVLSFLT